MVEPFNAALNYMNIALTVEESECATVLGREIASVVDTSYCAFYEKKVSELKMKEQLKELNKDNRYASSSNGGVPYSYGLGQCTYVAYRCSLCSCVETLPPSCIRGLECACVLSTDQCAADGKAVAFFCAI